VYETRVSQVSFFFDGADQLLRVETPQDRDEGPSSKIPQKNQIKEAICKAKKFIIARIAHEELDRALALLEKYG